MVLMLPCLMFWPPALGLTVQERASKFFVGHHPPCVYPLPTLCLPDVTSNVPGVPTSIACSVQIQKGKAWEMCLCAVTSGRQRVDMWKQCLTVMIPVSYWTAPWMMSGIDAALLNALASSPRTDSTRKGFEILCWAPPPMCLPDVTTRNQIPQAYYKRSNTGGGNGLEIG